MNIQPLFDGEEILSSEEVLKIHTKPEKIEEFVPIVTRFRRLKPLYQYILLQVLEKEFKLNPPSSFQGVSYEVKAEASREMPRPSLPRSILPLEASNQPP